MAMPAAPCHVIVTTRTLLWTLLTIASALSMLSAVLSPYWLYGVPRLVVTNNRLRINDLNRQPAPTSQDINNVDDVADDEGLTQLPVVLHEHHASGGQESLFSPTVGIFNRCTWIQRRVNRSHGKYSCAPFVTSSFFGMDTDEFPAFWKASLVFFAIGLFLMALTMGSSVIACCIRAIKRKSIYTISGTVQAVAGLFYVLGLVFYPFGWGTKRVALLCGPEADYYMLGGCSFGWCFYLAIGATLLTLLCSVLSVKADTSTSSDKVQDEIFEGKHLICLI